MILENMGTVIISAVVSVTLGLITYFGANKRAQIDADIAEQKAEREAVKSDSELDLKLAEREDRLRAKLWEDVEEKMAKQAERIATLEQGKAADRERIETLEATVVELRKMLETKEEENSRLRAENKLLKNGNIL